MLLRALVAASLLALLTIILLPVQVLAVSRKWALRRSIPHLFHRLACPLIGVRISVIGTPPRHETTLIVSNHSSWLDVAAISAVTPTVFIAKREIERWPVFGLLAKLQRSVFVDRQRRRATDRVNEQIAQRLASGDHVVLFAEGTSGDGTRILPFRSALVGAAATALVHDIGRAHILVQPLSIVYTRLQGIPLGREHRFHTAWCGTVALVPHLVHVLREGALDVTLSWGEPFRYTLQSDRKTVTRELQIAVRKLSLHASRLR